LNATPGAAVGEMLGAVLVSLASGRDGFPPP